MTNQKQNKPATPDKRKAKETNTPSLPELVDADEVSEQDREDPSEDFVMPGDGLSGFGVVDIAAGEKTARPLDHRTALEILTRGANSDDVMDEIDDHTSPLSDIEEDFAARQEMNTGTERLYRKLREHTADAPELSAEDIDAAWEKAGVGEETVGGTAPTPDQDNVDELGEAVGLTYEDDEPLGIGRKLEEREQHRWELDPASADDAEEDEDQR